MRFRSSKDWEDLCANALPALGAAAGAALAAVPAGEAFHMAVRTQMCNSFNPRRLQDRLTCQDCAHAAECTAQVEKTILFAARMNGLLKARK